MLAPDLPAQAQACSRDGAGLFLHQRDARHEPLENSAFASMLHFARKGVNQY